jgi:4'-phosphopantetheinyl transferase
MILAESTSVRVEEAELAFAWPGRRAVAPIAAGEVHVWAAALDVARERQVHLASMLAPDERERASRFRRADLTRRWVAGRGVLRELLAAYLGIEPRRVAFAYDAFGKPSLADAMRSPWLRFNVSHSSGCALYACAAGVPIGVDVEALVEFADMTAVAERFFSPAERAQLAGVRPEQATPAFYACWTRKEAYLKARGVGLLAPLDGFDVSIAAGERAAVLRVDGDPEAPARWALGDLRPAAGYVGAVAVEVPAPRVRCWTWAG